ncbi:MAG: NUDIX domain-containing protein [Anaerolineae bacterium]|nr:NUDIX domain-containing protein [Anaerolineae bacterium]
MKKADQGPQAKQGLQASQERYHTIPRVLIFVHNRDDILLIKGAPTKRIWANRYNGIGGHVEADENIYTAAQRETLEETGLEVHHLRLRGVVNIDVGKSTGIMLFVFTAHSDKRQTRPSAEGTLEWVSRTQLLEYDLVEDVPVLLERMAQTDNDALPFFARYDYDERDQLRITFAALS